MAYELATAYVSLAISGKDLRKQVDDTIGEAVKGRGGSQGKQVGKRLALGMAAGVAAAGGAALLFKPLIGEASNLEQSVGGLKAVFKGSFKEMNKQSQNAAKNLGLSKNEYNELSTVLGAGLKNKGIKDYAGATQDLVGVGADLAAQFGGSTQDSVSALAAAMRGESDPIERYGISLNESAVNAKLAEMGMDGLEGAALEQAKTQARLALITEQSADAQGAFARESDTLAGQQQRLGAQFDNIKASLGKALLPALSSMAAVVSEKVLPAVKGFIEDFRAGAGAAGQLRAGLESFGSFVTGAVVPAVKALGGWVARNKELLLALVGGVLAGVVAFKAFMFINTVIKAVKAARLAVLAFNASLLANPIGLVVAAIAVLVGALIYLYRNNETVRKAIDKAWAAIKKAIKATVDWFKNVAWPVMKQVLKAIGDAAMWLWRNAIKPAFGFIWDIAKKVFGWIKNTGWPLVKSAFDAIGKAAKWLWNKALKPAFNWIKDGASAVFGWIKNTGWPWVKAAFDNIKAAAGWLWDKMKAAFNKIKGGAQSFADKIKWLRDWIKRYFEAIKGNAEWLWGKVKLAFDKLKSGVNAVKKAFSDAKDGIGRAWDKVYGKITGPIKKAMKWLNKNLIGKLNTLLGNIPGVDFRIPELNTEGFARGGILPGFTPMSRGDDRLTPMRSGEGVMVSEGLRDPRSRSMFLAANAAAKRGTSFADFMGGGYAGGGIVGWAKSFLPDWAEDLADSPLGFIKGKISGFMDNMPSTFGLAGEILPGIAKMIASGVGSKVASVFDVSGLIDKFMPDDFKGGGGNGGAGVQQWRGVVAQALSMLGLPLSLMDTTLRRMNQESGGNAQAINLWDINAQNGVPSKGLMQVIDPTFQAYKMPGHNDIWNPLDNILASMRYALARYGSLPAAYNRAGGYAGGGIVQPAVFDNGGTLAPGLNLVHNKLGRPEPLVRPEQAMAGLEITGTLDTPWGPAQVRGIVKDELTSQARQARIQGAR